jgi:NTP pyrophosphatase (non-canonical NTP hydrolase)
MDHKYQKYGTPLIKLIEECSEVIQACCKVDRFGLDNYHPETNITNREQINSEISDLLIAIENFRKWENEIPYDKVIEIPKGGNIND